MADISKMKLPDGNTYNVKDSNAITGSGTSGCIAKFNGTKTVTDGPALGSNTHTFLRNDGQWSYPLDPKAATSSDAEMPVTFIGDTQTTGTYYGQLGFNGNLVFNPDRVITGPFANEYAYLKLSDDNPDHDGIIMRSDGIINCGTIGCGGAISATGSIYSQYGLYGGNPAVEFPHKYSADEKVVGFWLGGQAIYQRTITLSSDKTVNANSWNNDIYTFDEEVTILDCEVLSYNATNHIFMNCKFVGCQSVTANRKKLGLYNSRDAAVTVHCIIPRYVKATNL